MGRYAKVLLTVIVLALFAATVMRCCNAESRVSRLMQEREMLVDGGYLERLREMEQALEALKNAIEAHDDASRRQDQRD